MVPLIQLEGRRVPQPELALRVAGTIVCALDGRSQACMVETPAMVNALQSGRSTLVAGTVTLVGWAGRGAAYQSSMSECRQRCVTYDCMPPVRCNVTP
jgi:hypothetical protein